MDEHGLLALPVGTVLVDGNTQYEIVDPGNASGFLGQGGFGITYLARDKRLERDVAIKEFFPSAIASRGATLSVASRDAEQFNSLKKYFLGEARILAGFDDPRIVKVLAFFEANNTAYMVMPFLSGDSVSDRYKVSPFSEGQAVQLLLQLVGGLKTVHANGVLHRDIKPDNIKYDIQTDTPILIDFGSARTAIGPGTDSTFGAYSPHFSPIELNSTNTRKTVATDIYALAATAYRAMFQSGPPDAAHRFEQEDDGLPELEVALSKGGISQQLASILRKSLELRAKDRFQTLDELELALNALIAPPRPVVPSRRAWVYAAAAIIAPGLALAGYWFSDRAASVSPPRENTVAAAPAPANAATPAPVAAEPPVVLPAVDPAIAAWTSAEARNSIAGYTAFLAQFPDSPNAAEARQRIATLQDDNAWIAARDAGTPVDARVYLATCNLCAHRDDALQLLLVLDASAWELAERRHTIASYAEYLLQFPNGEHAAEAVARQGELAAAASASAAADADEAAWLAAVSEGTRRAFEAYLSNHPQGHHVEEARDELAWRIAQQDNTAESYRRYLGEHPTGQHLHEAQAALETLLRIQATTAAITECNRLASSTRYPSVLPSEEVGFWQIDPDLAVPACAAAQAAAPQDERAAYQYSRATLRGAYQSREASQFFAWRVNAESQCSNGANEICALLGEYVAGDTIAWRADHAAAQRILDGACNAGSVAGCLELGWLIRDAHDGVVEDESRAVALFQDGCNSGNPEHCVALGAMTETGQGVSRDYAEARRLYEQACDADESWGCGMLGLLYANGLGVAANPADAFDHFQRACDLGGPLGCYRVLSSYREGLGVAEDDARALQMARAICETGDPVGCAYLGYAFDTGQGVAQDYDEARRLYEQSCEDGSAWGCARLAAMFGDGLGVARDEPRAFSLFQRACDGGNEWGCRKVAAAYRDGLGVQEDDAVAVRLFEEGCRNGDIDSCVYLGYSYETAEGVAQDDAAALRLHEQSCEANSAWGCARLGAMHENGAGTPVDNVTAGRFYERGCELGNSWACGNIGTMHMHQRLPNASDALAATWYEQGCRLENSYSCAQLGILNRDGRFPTASLDAAFESFSTACELGRSWGCREAGLLISSGRVAVPDATQEQTRLFARTLELLDEYCVSNPTQNANDCKQLGDYYLGGEIVAEDRDRAISYYRMACDNDDGYGCESLAILLEDTRQPIQGMAARARACELGRGTSCAMHATALYYFGDIDGSISYAIRSLEAGDSYLIDNMDDSGFPPGSIPYLSDDEYEDFRRGLQNALRSRGLYSGSIDGVFGPNMENAMRELCGC